jgi:nucleoside-triphosphatase THEP1
MAAWAVITGDKGEGKSLRARAAAARLRERGLRVGGFVQQAVCEPDGTRLGYDLVRLAGGTPVPLARRAQLPHDAQIGFCSHTFEPTAFAGALAWLREEADAAEVLFIDAVGKLETASGGHAAAVRFALALPAPTVVVLCIRAEQLFPATEAFLREAGEAVGSLEEKAEEEALTRFVDAVYRAVRGGSGADNRRP